MGHRLRLFASINPRYFCTCRILVRLLPNRWRIFLLTCAQNFIESYQLNGGFLSFSDAVESLEYLLLTLWAWKCCLTFLFLIAVTLESQKVKHLLFQIPQETSFTTSWRPSESKYSCLYRIVFLTQADYRAEPSVIGCISLEGGGGNVMCSRSRSSGIQLNCCCGLEAWTPWSYAPRTTALLFIKLLH